MVPRQILVYRLPLVVAAAVKCALSTELLVVVARDPNVILYTLQLLGLLKVVHVTLPTNLPKTTNTA